MQVGSTFRAYMFDDHAYHITTSWNPSSFSQNAVPAVFAITPFALPFRLFLSLHVWGYKDACA